MNCIAHTFLFVCMYICAKDGSHSAYVCVSVHELSALRVWQCGWNCCLRCGNSFSRNAFLFIRTVEKNVCTVLCIHGKSMRLASARLARYVPLHCHFFHNFIFLLCLFGQAFRNASVNCTITPWKSRRLPMQWEDDRNKRTKKQHKWNVAKPNNQQNAWHLKWNKWIFSQQIVANWNLHVRDDALRTFIDLNQRLSSHWAHTHTHSRNWINESALARIVVTWLTHTHNSAISKWTKTFNWSLLSRWCGFGTQKGNANGKTGFVLRNRPNNNLFNLWWYG